MSESKRQLKVGIIGNPNCGKSTIFNGLTGSQQVVGNWPGVTVEKKVGSFEEQGIEIELIDLPGAYTLSMNDTSSIDEQVAVGFLVKDDYDLIINVIDASNLERNLYLTTQLIEMKVPMIVALNMIDVAKSKLLDVHPHEIENVLGVKVIPTNARKGKGIKELKKAVLELPKVPKCEFCYPKEIKEAIDEIRTQLGGSGEVFNKEWLAFKLLEEEVSLVTADAKLKKTIDKHHKKIEEKFDEDAEIVISSIRYDLIASITKGAVKKVGEVRKSITDKIDSIFLNRLLGIPLFLGIMYLMFTFSIVIGGAFQSFFELTSQAIFVDGFADLLRHAKVPEWGVMFFAGGVGGGITTVAPFIPIIGALYLFLSFLEDSGYMARAAFIMDRFMRALGLPGKSFVPLIVGFGCNVPAVMATRTLENERDRITTVMMAPFMSCGARLSVYALFCAAFFPHTGQNIVFALYLIGIVVALITGFLLKVTVLKGQASYFVMELPNYHMPTFLNVMRKTYDRLKGFIIRAGKLIVIMFLVLHMLNAIGTDGSFGHEDSESSVLSTVGKAITPVFEPMGVGQENWPATVGIFVGVFAKEVVVGSLNALYLPEPSEDDEFNLIDALKSAVLTIPENLSAIYDDLASPIWLNMSDADMQYEFLEGEGANRAIFKPIIEKFNGKIGAFAYLLFILLYFPCISAYAAIVREINHKWALFSAAWSTALAYAVAVIFYQLAMGYVGQAYSLTMVFAMVVMLASMVIGLQFSARVEAKKVKALV